MRSRIGILPRSRSRSWSPRRRRERPPRGDRRPSPARRACRRGSARTPRRECPASIPEPACRPHLKRTPRSMTGWPPRVRFRRFPRASVNRKERDAPGGQAVLERSDEALPLQQRAIAAAAVGAGGTGRRLRAGEHAVPAEDRPFPGYLAINPLGTVPTFVDGELTMTESTGICHYLGEKFAPNPLRVVPTSRPTASTSTGSTAATPPSPSRRRSCFATRSWSRRSGACRRRRRTIRSGTFRACAAWRARWKAANSSCADRFTMADIAVHFALFLGRTLGLDARYKPNCLAYLDRLMERPAFQRAMAKQE